MNQTSSGKYGGFGGYRGAWGFGGVGGQGAVNEYVLEEESEEG